MATPASSKLLQVTAESGTGAARRSQEPDRERWVIWIRWIALLVFLGIPVLGWFVPRHAGRVVWTVAVASLPLFIILVGYHRWRLICPLAFFAQLPWYLNRAGTRRASPWLEANYYFIAVATFTTGLWLRLIATNGDGRAIAGFFVMIAAAATGFGLVYTGKTWCNYICPVSFIEKIYTEPQGIRATPNSQCSKCTACKKSCPDINEENGYWKEIESKPKRAVYFSYPGLVFGFYFYYFLQSGTWNYYFGGSWTNQAGMFRTAFLPGHNGVTAGFFFNPVVPRALASLLTLIACALVSFVVFAGAEKILERRFLRRDRDTDAARIRHWVFSIAAFTALIIFYSFAGAPTLRLIPGATRFAELIVVATATLTLLRRFPRTPKAFAEDSLGRNILKRWPWTDVKPPKDLREAFLIHTIRSHQSEEGYARLVEMYKDAVRETVADGFVTRETVNVLLSLRTQLQIKPADHEKAMAQLAEEERSRIHHFPSEVSAEKRLQLDSYSQALQAYLDRVLAANGAPDDGFIKRLRVTYRISPDEHAAAIFELMGEVRGNPNYMVLAFLEAQAGGRRGP
jgi:hypothetical protein